MAEPAQPEACTATAEGEAPKADEVKWTEPIPYADYSSKIAAILQRDIKDEDVIKTQSDKEMSFKELMELEGDALSSAFPITVKVMPEKKKRGKPKDVNAPPKPKAPFGKFGAECRVRLKEERPELISDLSAMGKALADEWAKVPEEEKARLQEVYEKEMAIWKPKWAAYKQTRQYKDFVEVKTDWLDKRAQKKLVKTMNKDAPKRPKSGYMIFAGEVRESVLAKVKELGLGLGDAGRLISERWAELTEGQKAGYDERSQKYKIQFEKEYSVYKKSEAFGNYMTEKVKLETLQKLKKSSRINLDGAPKKPPSGFALFKNEVMPEIAKENESRKEGEKLTCGDLTKKVGEKWAALSEEKKAEYNDTSEKGRLQWEKEYKAFKSNKKYFDFLEERKRLKARENTMVQLREMPKKPKSVFAMFAEEHKKEVEPGKGEGKGQDALKKKFASCSMEEKRKLEEKRKELEEAWEKDLAEYKSSVKYATFESTKKKIEEEFKNEAIKVTTLKFLSAAPAAPPKSAFSVFLGEKRKADADAGGEKKDKKAKTEEVNKCKTEFLKMEKAAKEEYEVKQKQLMKAYEEEVREFMKGEMWQEYQKEAKRMKIPIKSLMLHKKQVIKSLKNKDGSINIGAIPLPNKPESYPSKPRPAMKLFMDSKKGSDMTPAAISEAWKSLSAEDKAEWDKQASEDEKRFKDAKELFDNSDEGKKYYKEMAIATRRRKAAIAKDKYLKDYPKKPPVAFVEFLTKNKSKVKKENPDLKGFELEKKVKEMWSGLPEDEKAALEKAAKDKMDEFVAAETAFKASDNWKKYTMMTKVKVGKFGKKQAKSKAKGKGKAKAKAKSGPAPPSKPESMPKKPSTAFEAFAKELAASGKGCALGEMQKRFAALAADEKQRYVKEADERREKYAADMAAWEKTPDARRYRMKTISFTKTKKMKFLKEKFMKEEPKRPQSAYFIFVAENRSKIAAENPDSKKLGDVMGKVSQAWKNLSDSDRKVWLDKEKQVMDEYQEKLAEFQKGDNFKKYKRFSNSVMNLGKAKGKGKAKKKAGPVLPPEPAGLPKAPKNAYFLFGEHCRSTGGPKGLKEVQQKWLEIGAEGQKEWMEKAESAKKKYEEDMAAFKQTLEGKKYLRLKHGAEKKMKLASAKKKFLTGDAAPAEPKRPASAYFIFLAEKAATVKDTETKKKSQILTEAWSGLSAEEKKTYEDKAATLKAKYEEDMKAYKNSKGFKEYEKTLNRLSGKNEQKKQAQLRAKAKKEEILKKREAAKEAKQKTLSARSEAKTAKAAEAKTAKAAAKVPKTKAAPKTKPVRPAPTGGAPPAKKAGSASSSNAMGSDSKSGSKSSSSSSKSSSSD